MIAHVQTLIVGMLAAGYLTASVFFLRFWRTTNDRLFLFFSLAFALMSSQRIMSVLTLEWTESTGWTYWLRLAGYLMILVGIVDKNRPDPRR